QNQAGGAPEHDLRPGRGEVECGIHGWTPTLAASLHSAATLPPKAGAPFAPWGGPAAQMWTPTLAASLHSAAALPPKAGAQFAPWGGPAALTLGHATARNAHESSIRPRRPCERARRAPRRSASAGPGGGAAPGMHPRKFRAEE